MSFAVGIAVGAVGMAALIAWSNDVSGKAFTVWLLKRVARKVER